MPRNKATEIPPPKTLLFDGYLSTAKQVQNYMKSLGYTKNDPTSKATTKMLYMISKFLKVLNTALIQLLLLMYE